MKIEKPWGSYEVLLEQEDYVVKKLTLHPAKQFSLQKHEHRDEEWVVLEGEGLLTLGPDVDSASQSFLSERSRAMVPQGFVHRLLNINTNKNLEVLEIWWGGYGKTLSEEDIIRYADDYGRKD
tara:strand:- start:214 stop:582 length:369 start_codon:yes stop_codon:yes gene_type:complete